MKRIISTLLVMALILGTMPLNFAATPAVSTTFKSIGDLAGAHMLTDTDENGKANGPYFALLVINSKGVVTEMERQDQDILPVAVEGYPTIKLVLAKDKKSISFNYGDSTVTVTKDKKGNLVMVAKYPGDDTAYPYIVQSFKDKDKAFAAIKADKKLKKLIEDMNSEVG